MPDRITIARWHDRHNANGIMISIESEAHQVIYVGDMSLEDFAKAITGYGSMDIIPDERYKVDRV